MDNNRPSINNGNASSHEGDSRHVGPGMVNEAPSILKDKKYQQEKFTQTPPPNYQSAYSFQGAPQGAQPYYTYQQKKGGWKKGLLIFGIIVAVLIFIGFISYNFMDSLFHTKSTFEIPDENYIARIAVEGTISASSGKSYMNSGSTYNHQFVLDSLDNITEDSNNVALLLFVNSPGGGVYESDQIYNKIKTYQAKTKRPVYVAMGSMAASGGYYISAPADKIIADRNCWTGSIGVTLGTHYDISELLEKYGIKAENLTSGKNKAMGSMVEPLTKEQRQIFQSLLDDAYVQFTTLIAEGRNMDINDVIKLADGRIYTANQAKENGLIDEIATEEEALEILKSDNNIEGELVKFNYYSDTWLDELIVTYVDPLVDSIQSLSNGDLGKAMNLVEESKNTPVQYLYVY